MTPVMTMVHRLNETSDYDATLLQKKQNGGLVLGRLLVAVSEIANNETLGCGDGARIVGNNGQDGGQEVNHLH